MLPLERQIGLSSEWSSMLSLSGSGLEGSGFPLLSEAGLQLTSNFHKNSAGTRSWRSLAIPVQPDSKDRWHVIEPYVPPHTRLCGQSYYKSGSSQEDTPMFSTDHSGGWWENRQGLSHPGGSWLARGLPRTDPQGLIPTTPCGICSHLLSHNQSILKEINSKYPLEGLMLRLKLQ